MVTRDPAVSQPRGAKCRAGLVIRFWLMYRLARPFLKPYILNECCGFKFSNVATSPQASAKALAGETRIDR
jgi:hypothetical protein